MKRIALGLAAATAITTACAPPLMGTLDVLADRVARPAFMVERVIPAGPFMLTAWERMHAKNKVANVYIEGDGLAWISPGRMSLDPTPKNPVALHMAAFDRAENLVYLARPCQYSGMADKSPCPSKYWTDARFAPEVIAAYHEALDNIRRMYDVTGFHLIGYSGGAGVAALVAAERKDVLSLRTVAGNLDTEAFTSYHNVSPMAGSLNPVTVAPQLATLPQHHFIGGNDQVIPPAIFHSWSQSSGPSDCVRHTIVTENQHENGWAEKWPSLLNVPLECEVPAPPAPAPVPYEFYDVKK